MLHLHAAAVLLLASSARCRTLAPAPAAGPLELSSTWLVSKGESCSAVCGAGRAYGFGTSSLCATAGSAVVGFESSNSPGVCQTAAGASSSFWCRCLEADQSPGLALALPGDRTCDSSCAQALPGMAGTGVSVVDGSQQRVCMAHDDIGASNRFRPTEAGSAQAQLSCRAGADSLSGAAFSCACLYKLQPTSLPRVAGNPSVAAQSVSATLG